MGRKKSITCDDCFFKQNQLCALDLAEPCVTFRPAGLKRLKPPSQTQFVFRQERKQQKAWTFPTAEQQAALYDLSNG